MRKVPVRGSPRVVKVALEDVRSNNLGNGLEEVLSDDGVLGGDDVDGGVLMSDALYDGEDGGEVLNVRRVSIDSAGERLSLMPSL